jgi:hypothetical protein
MKSIRPAKILDYAANNGFSVEDIDSYSGQHKPLTFRCLKCNNTFKRTWNNLRANTNCPSCNPKKWSIERIQTEIENRGTGWELLSTEYKNNKEPLIFRCPSGHILRKPMQQWLLWDCPIYSGLSSKTEQEVRTCVEKEGYELLDAQLRAGSKILSTSILTILCDRGHIYKTRWSYCDILPALKDGASLGQLRCP